MGSNPAGRASLCSKIKGLGLTTQALFLCPVLLTRTCTIESTLMNNRELLTIAYGCGAKPHTQGLMRAVTGVSMTFDQLAAFAAALDGPWKEAVINELIVAHLYQAKHDQDPRRAIQDAISWNTDVALDPLVSSDAQKLIDRGAAEERARSQA